MLECSKLSLKYKGMDLFHARFMPVILFEAANDGGSGGGSNGTPSNPQPNNQGQAGSQGQPNPLPDHAVQSLQNLAQRAGGESEAAKLLFNDNYQLREKARHLESQLPGEDAVVLKGEDAKQWEEFRKLGKPDEIKSIVDEHQEVKGKLTKIERENQIKGIAEKAGYNFNTLKQLAGDDVQFETESVTVDGKQVDQVMVVEGDGDNKTKTKLSDYAEKNWSDFIPVLKADAQPPKEKPKGIGFPGQQPSSSNNGPSDKISDRINRNREAAGYKKAE